jgi:protein SCO1/2
LGAASEFYEQVFLIGGKMRKKLLIILLLVSAVLIVPADKKLGIEEKLGNKIPAGLTFTDETGNQVELKSLIDRPTVLMFVYYECPGICTPLMSEVASVINHTDLEPGIDYNIISISFDHSEGYELASKKKVNYLKSIDKYFPKEAWRFLTGDSASIYKLTDAAGFYFQREGEEYIHSGTLIFIDKGATITRYLYPGYSERKQDFSILPFDFKMAVMETSEGKITPSMAKLVKYCFSYDPEGKTYVFNFTRVFGAGIVILAGIFVVFLTVKPKKKK